MYSILILLGLYSSLLGILLSYLGSPPNTSLDRVEPKASHLTRDPSLTSTLDPLSLRHMVASLTIFYRYYFGHCSDELAAYIPPPMAQPSSTQQASFAHSYCVELPNARINQFSDGFFPSTSRLWNSLPSSVFLASFKRQVYHHLGTRCYFFFSCVLLFSFLSILAICFIRVIAFSFS